MPSWWSNEFDSNISRFKTSVKARQTTLSNNPVRNNPKIHFFIKHAKVWPRLNQTRLTISRAFSECSLRMRRRLYSDATSHLELNRRRVRTCSEQVPIKYVRIYSNILIPRPFIIESILFKTTVIRFLLYLILIL